MQRQLPRWQGSWRHRTDSGTRQWPPPALPEASSASPRPGILDHRPRWCSARRRRLEAPRRSMPPLAKCRLGEWHPLLWADELGDAIRGRATALPWREILPQPIPLRWPAWHERTYSGRFRRRAADAWPSITGSPRPRVPCPTASISSQVSTCRNGCGRPPREQAP